MRTKALILVSVAGIALVLSGCATIVSGTKQTVTVNSTPQATVTITADSGQQYYSGKTPTTIRLPRSHTYTVKISLSGYQTQTMIIDHSINPWLFGNLFLALIWGVLDAVDGAMWNLEPSQVNATLDTAMIQQGSNMVFVARIVDENGASRTYTTQLQPEG